MVIDTHIRPALYAPICGDEKRFQQRCDEMNYHLMNPSDIKLLKKQYALADIQKAFLLPDDCSAKTGTPAISNEEVAKIVAIDPDFFLGFASVDPRLENAAELLERAFLKLGLSGLYINTSRLQMYPYDETLIRLYDICSKYHKPVIFHAGLSLENNTLARFARPIEFEEVMLRYPNTNICLTHMGWPWVQETAALLLKYSNAYASTGLMNFDGPYQIYEKVFREDMGALWVEHNISDKIMFGSDSPRIRPVRAKRGLDSLGFSEETRKKIEYKNACRFMGGGVTVAV
nr:amidohydrolase family protein [uncultured Clostridium sp.]